MNAKQSSMERMLEVGQLLLAKAESLVRFLGPFRSDHPEWERLCGEARRRLKPSDAVLAARMDKALARLRRAEVMGQVEHERQRLADGGIVTKAERQLPLLEELMRLGLVELVRDGDDDKLVPHGSEAELEEAADNLVKRAKDRYRRARAVAFGWEKAAMPAIATAENEVAAEWLRNQVQPLRDLYAEFEAFVADHAVVLPGLIDLQGQRFGVWKGPSVSAVILAIMETVFDLLGDKESAPKHSDLAALDWEELRVKLACEVAEMVRRTAPAKGTPRRVRYANEERGVVGKAFDYLLVLRKLHESDPEARLSAQQIVAAVLGGGSDRHCLRTMNESVGRRLQDGMTIERRVGRPSLFRLVKHNGT